ncbi:MAG: cupredoxin domain-containing protein [Xanthobacteraceae bacterium]
MRYAFLALFGAAILAQTVLPARAQQAVEISITVKDNKFDPAAVEAPANTPIRFKVKNLDPKPMEFESKSLKFEKIITGGSEVTVNVRAQKPGSYEFYDDFHEDTTRGTLTIK